MYLLSGQLVSSPVGRQCISCAPSAVVSRNASIHALSPSQPLSRQSPVSSTSSPSLFPPPLLSLPPRSCHFCCSIIISLPQPVGKTPTLPQLSCVVVLHSRKLQTPLLSGPEKRRPSVQVVVQCHTVNGFLLFELRSLTCVCVLCVCACGCACCVCELLDPPDHLEVPASRTRFTTFLPRSLQAAPRAGQHILPMGRMLPVGQVPRLCQDLPSLGTRGTLPTLLASPC